MYTPFSAVSDIDLRPFPVRELYNGGAFKSALKTLYFIQYFNLCSDNCVKRQFVNASFVPSQITVLGFLAFYIVFVYLLCYYLYALL